MIFDITDIATGLSTRYKPRAKARCTGEVWYRGEEVASLKLLAITVTEDLVGGKFAIEWHRMDPQEKILEALTLVVQYHELGQTPRTWTIPDVQIITEGTLLAIHTLDELFGEDVRFFARSITCT